MSEARKIIDHEQVRRWAEERGGVPVVVKGTENGEGAGVLRIDFDGREPNLKPVNWEEFFDTFERKNLALLAQDKIGGRTSRFFKFVER